MMQKDQQASLFSEFSKPGVAEWEEKIKRDLKGQNPQTLQRLSYEGITVKPFYTQEDIKNAPQSDSLPGKFPFVRGHKTTDNAWQNIQEIKVTGNSQAAIDKARHAVANGADGVHFKIEQEDIFDTEYLISQLNITQVPVCYSVTRNPDKFLANQLQHLKKHGISPHGLKGFIYHNQPMSSEYLLGAAAQLDKLAELTKDAVAFYGITVNGIQFSNRGATAVQELAFTLSMAVHYTDILSARGVTLQTIFRNMQFLVGIGPNYFFEIAKFRALRWLWSGIVKASEEPVEFASYLRLHAQTSSWHATTFDPHTNILRHTTEAMAAIIGGCDSISISPFDCTYTSENLLSEQIARHIPPILKHEAYLNQAIDPAAGSYYLETLTQELAEKAWALFLEIEKTGGFAKALGSGFIKEQLDGTAQEKFRNISSGKEVIVGTNQFANKEEKTDYDIEALIQSRQFDNTRASYPFEVIRFAALLHFKRQNARPKAVIAIIGQDIQEHIHAAFAKEFFECGEFETEIIHFDSVNASLEKLLFIQCRIIVLSGTESEYERFSRHFTEALRKHKNRPVLILAASPNEMQEELAENGFDGQIFQNCNTASIIGRIQEKLLSNEA